MVVLHKFEHHLKWHHRFKFSKETISLRRFRAEQSIQKILNNGLIKIMHTNKLRRQVTHLSLLFLLNRRIYNVVQLYIQSTIFVPLFYPFYANRFSRQIIINTFFLTSYVQQLHITQKSLAVVPRLAPHRTSICKRNCFLQVYVFRYLIQMIPQSVSSILSTTRVLHVPASKQYGLPCQLHLL